MQKYLSKVPEITIYFWIIKILTTGMGETTSDFFVKLFDPVIVVLIAGIILGISLLTQLYAKRYNAFVYWFAVIMVSIFGTMVADVMHIALGIPYLTSTIFFTICLAIIFYLWHKSEKTLSIHSIYTFKRELFYWATILTTFALGTATGDMTATTLHLGYFSSGILFLILIIIPLIGYWKFQFNEIFAFWFAYIMTRPLGASFSDWMGVSTARGGLDLGTGWVSLVELALIIVLVWYISRRKEYNNYV